MPAVGPMPRFAESQILKTLELISEHERISRKQLVKELGIGEGSVRTILDRLKRDDLITSSKVGHTLTSKGRRKLGNSCRKFVQVDAGSLTVGKSDIATIVRGGAKRVKKGIEERDEAIKVGADGATVLVFKGGKLKFPDGVARIEPPLARKLIDALSPHENDVVILGTGRDPATAEAGAKAAAHRLS